MLGGQLGGARPLIIRAEVGEHRHDPRPYPRGVRGMDGHIQGGLGVFAAADVDQQHVIAVQRGRVHPAGRDGPGRWRGDLGEVKQRALAGDGRAGGHAASACPVIASARAEISTSATGGVTALPYWRTFSRWVPSTT